MKFIKFSIAYVLINIIIIIKFLVLMGLCGITLNEFSEVMSLLVTSGFFTIMSLVLFSMRSD